MTALRDHFRSRLPYTALYTPQVGLEWRYDLTMAQVVVSKEVSRPIVQTTGPF